MTTLLLLSGENPKVVSKWLGHASVILTLDTYSHILPGMQEQATSKLEEMLFGVYPTAWHTNPIGFSSLPCLTIVF